MYFTMNFPEFYYQEIFIFIPMRYNKIARIESSTRGENRIWPIFFHFMTH